MLTCKTSHLLYLDPRGVSGTADPGNEWTEENGVYRGFKTIMIDGYDIKRRGGGWEKREQRMKSMEIDKLEDSG